MSIQDTEIKELNSIATRLKTLTDNPSPGIMTWWIAVADTLKELKKFQTE